MIGNRITEAFNFQLNAELYSAYLYLSMSASLASQNLPGFAAWMRAQTKEEFQHAMKFYDHIIARGGKVQLTAIDPPPTDWDGPLAVFEHTCKHERKVTGLINDLVILAKSEGDTESEQFLQWFVDEQVEEEENVGKVLEMVKKAGDSASELQNLDRELAKRGQS
jgi:ferritin